MTMTFTPSREAGLGRLDAFLPDAGSRYAKSRNFDFGPERRSNVSMLSPYLRHRLVLEEEAIVTVLGRHSFSSAEKFVQEVCWRTYWKGWLEMRPHVWSRYNESLAALEPLLDDDGDLRRSYDDAVEGRTGIACFDAWVRDLVDVGYVHNHARMWFASIWIFTLELPWELGADFFFRHLYDGDPASNTLSWRWVAGLHTAGKTYLARADNIATYTGGRFTPAGVELSSRAPALTETDTLPRIPLAPASDMTLSSDVTLLVTEEDCYPETLALGQARVKEIAALDPSFAYGANHSGRVIAFKKASVAEAAQRAAAHFGCSVTGTASSAELQKVAEGRPLVTAYVPCGPLRDALACRSLPVTQIRRAWDSKLWPHATAGFFKLKEKIPAAIAALSIEGRRRP